ncbi:MAG TPA: Rieske 2Fe-2S domain-containing protein [Candidatus Nitrosopolaris sp.]|nr:Rieske 2Fe-2S domain-containing protein [Candidatus Nitrosopolaris sp.]
MDIVAKEGEEYKKVANKRDLQEGGLLKVESGGKPVVLSMVKGKVYAIDAVCSHEGGPLEEGTLEGYEVECPWHGSKFDVRTGAVRNPPADTPQSVYEVKVENNDILVRQAHGQLMHHENPSEAISRQKGTSAVYELTLLEKQKFEGTDIMSFKFSRQNEQHGGPNNDNTYLYYKAGQFAFFDIGGVSNDPKGPIRHFTIASSPTEDFIMFSTRIRDTPYKNRLSSLEERAKVKVRGPEGKFVLHDDYSKPAVFLSGGIGVTPFRSMIKYATDERLPVKINMFDSNRDQTNILYKNEFDECLKTNNNLKIIYTITTEEHEQAPSSSGWKGERGIINKAMLTKYLTTSELDNSVFYICGPPGMLKAMQNLLQDDLHIPKERLKVEEFTGY